MKIKKFRARTFSEAIKEIKRTLGSDAVILSSEQIDGNMVDVVAAIDYEEPVRERIDNISNNQDEIRKLRTEIERLKETLVQMKASGYEMRLPESKRRILKTLLSVSIKEEFALRLCEKATDIDSLISAISEELKVMEPDRTNKVVMLIGPTGVGKTTTIIKLAAKAIKEGKRICIITLDTYRLGAVEQLKAFARILTIPLEVINNPENLREQVMKHSDKDRIFIDTTGRNPRDEQYLKQLRSIYSIDIPVQTHLIMSASSDDGFMTDAYKYYRQLEIDCLGFTKVDEAVNKGCIYNLAMLYQRPIAYITTGQRIPHDILFPGNRDLAKLILDRVAMISEKKYENTGVI